MKTKDGLRYEVASIDPDIWELASGFTMEAFRFVVNTDGDPHLQSITQLDSITESIALPIQRLRNYTKERRVHAPRSSSKSI